MDNDKVNMDENITVVVALPGELVEEWDIAPDSDRGQALLRLLGYIK